MNKGVHVCVCVWGGGGRIAVFFSFFLRAKAGNTPHIMFLILFIQFVLCFP